MNILIAAIAIQDKARLRTIDKHFEIIAQHSTFFLYKLGYGGMFLEKNDP